MKRVLLVGLLLAGGCVTPPDTKPDCNKVADTRCVLCVDRNGDADWYLDSADWAGCPKGTRLVEPNKKGG